LFSLLFGPDDAGPSTQPPPSSGIAYLADPIIIEFVFGMLIALVHRGGARLSMWAAISLSLAGFFWLEATIDSLSRLYSAGFAAALKRFPLELNRWDSHGFRDGRVFRH
jgi:peptidoglycan/LPS O-acetylase OafA/YrhL